MWSILNGRIGVLTYRQVVSFLKSQGFEMQGKGATSHEQWVRIDAIKGKLKVTVDKHHAPFQKALIKSMAAQAGFRSARDFYALCAGHLTEDQVPEVSPASEN